MAQQLPDLHQRRAARSISVAAYAAAGARSRAQDRPDRPAAITTWLTPAALSARCGAFTRTNTARPSALAGRPRADSSASASPTSTGSGNRSRRLPLPRTTISPGPPVDVLERQRRDLAAAHPQPDQQLQDREVAHDRPQSRRSQLAQQRRHLPGLQPTGSPASRQPATAGTDRRQRPCDQHPRRADSPAASAAP